MPSRLGAPLALAALFLLTGCPNDDEPEVVCGDGEVGAGEVCDGAELAGASCASQGLGAGTLACNATCTGFVTAGCCGDGVVGGNEVCDGTALAGQTCQSRGFGAGTLACNATCDAFVTSACCGDGVIGGDELCDGAATAGATCEAAGFGAGTVTCNATCDALDTSGCCGDGVKGGAEQCDGTDVGGTTCAAQGLGTGTVACTATCELDVTACCGDGTIGSGEVCDSTDVGGETCTGRGFRSGTLGCGATCAGYDTSGCCGDGDVGGAEACDDGNAVDGDTCNNACTVSTAVGGVRVCRSLPALQSGVCTATAGTTAAKLITADVLLDGELLQGGQVLIDAAGKIACVGCNCEADAAGAAQIVCPDAVVSPGLINSHDHITFNHQGPPSTALEERFEQRHDWRRGKRGHTTIGTSGSSTTADLQYSELRFVLGGATTTIAAGGASGFLRNLDNTAAQLEGLASGKIDSDTFPLGDSSGTQLVGSCDYGTPATATDLAAVAAYQGHVSEGIDLEARNEFLCTSTTWYDTTPITTTEAGKSHDLVQPKVAFVHGVGLKPQDYAQMAKDGTSLIWSPRSNVSLYGDTAVVTAAKAMGVNIALGTDWLISGSINVNRELACAAELNAQRYAHAFSDQELWKMVTVNAARAAERSAELGQLKVGLFGDVAIYDARTNAGYAAVVKAEPKDTVLVLRGGKVLSGDADVVAALESGCDTLDVCGAAKRVCSTRETGSSLPALTSAAGQSYPLFNCGAPANEPTCFPSRVVNAKTRLTYYPGTITSTDDDGDGVEDGADNCPTVFNAIRPVDEGVQSDVDDDGVGDACDPCPLGTNGDGSCVTDAETDVDMDGVANGSDNCPAVTNRSQTDTDGDQKGDACDACPNESNPGTAACTATIYAIKNGTVPAGSTVRVQNALVTAVWAANGYFLQVKPGDADYAGEDYSAVYVYSPQTASVAPGNRVSLASAGVQAFNGQIQLSNVSTPSILSTGEALPAPIVVDPALVATGGSRSEALEAALIQVQGVTVATVNSTASEFTVTGSLIVDDVLTTISPLPAVGAQYTSITGPLMHRSSQKRLLPRSAADLVAAPAFGLIYDDAEGVCRTVVAAR